VGLVPDVDWGLTAFREERRRNVTICGTEIRLKWMPLRGKPGLFAGVKRRGFRSSSARFEKARRTEKSAQSSAI